MLVVRDLYLGLFLLVEGVEELEDDGDGEKDSGAGSDGAHGISQHSERSDAQSSEGGRGGDVPVQLPLHVRVPMPWNYHLLLLIHH